MTNRRRMMSLSVGALAAPWALFPGMASAQPLPGVARIVTGFAAGGGSDVLARRIADKLRGVYAANVIVENRTGAGGRIAVEAVRNAAPDGLTMLFTPASPIVHAPAMYAKLSYEPLRDLLPVSTVSTIKLGLMVSTACPAKTLDEYFAWVRSDPRNGAYATPGAGTLGHFLGLALAKAAKTDLVHVSYRGAGPAVQDLLAAQVPAYIGIVGSDALNHVRLGKIRVLAVAESTRMAELPDVPTFTESGYPSVFAQEWLGMFLPAKTTAATAEALAAALAKAIADPEVKGLLARYAMGAETTTPALFTQRVKTETATWAPVIRASGFKSDD